MGEKKNEVHLVTDGHDKKLNPRKPFFNLSSQLLRKGGLGYKEWSEILSEIVFLPIKCIYSEKATKI